jgi:hypothetical protein
MFSKGFSSKRALLVIALATSVAATAPATADEITVVIDRVKAGDKIDVLTKPDLFARVTIAGETFKSKTAFDKSDIAPKWTFTKTVPKGTHKVKIELLDRDITNASDLIDINRLDKKRDLDFTVTTRSCRIGEISNSGCGKAITRAGKEPKNAEVSFTVTAKK